MRPHLWCTWHHTCTLGRSLIDPSTSPPLIIPMASQVRYPFLYSNLESLTLADVGRLLEQYKELVLKHEATVQVGRAICWGDPCDARHLNQQGVEDPRAPAVDSC